MAGARDLETAGSATEADDLYRQLDQSPSPSDERLGLRGGQEGSAVLDASLGAEQLAQGLLRGGRVGAPAEGGPEFLRRGRMVLALAGGTRQGGDDRILGADAGMDGIARRRGEALGNEVVLGGGEVLLGLAEECFGVVEPLSLGYQASPTVVRGTEPMSATPSRIMSLTTGSPERASCWNWLGVNTRTSHPLPTLVATAS
jgi:hypothetical protein